MEFMCIWKEIYFEELAHTVMEAGASKICSVGQQVGDAGEPVVRTRSNQSAGEFAPAGGGQASGSVQIFS